MSLTLIENINSYVIWLILLINNSQCDFKSSYMVKEKLGIYSSRIFKTINY